LAAIRSAVDEAKTAASTALDGLALDEKLAPVRKGARIIHEIAWRWREIGADSRICDLIDSQISAIEAACGQISSTDPQAALGAAFDLIQDRLREFDDSDPAPAEATEEAAASSAPAPAPLHEAPIAAAEMAQAETATETTPEAAMSAPAMPEEAMVATPEIAEAVADVGDVTAEAVDVTAENAEAADAHDEAVLDLIAFEMGAPDPDFDEPRETGELPDTDHAETHATELPPAAPDIVAPTPEPMATLAPPVMMSEPLLQPPVRPAIQPSLGSTLIASGMLLSPNAAPDPLAPIRRMSQAEKIAFFS
jgi:chemotaxis protein histidine kinase CheA